LTGRRAGDPRRNGVGVVVTAPVRDAGCHPSGCPPTDRCGHEVEAADSAVVLRTALPGDDSSWTLRSFSPQHGYISTVAVEGDERRLLPLALAGGTAA
jgi:hypothetical protein